LNLGKLLQKFTVLDEGSPLLKSTEELTVSIPYALKCGRYKIGHPEGADQELCDSMVENQMKNHKTTKTIPQHAPPSALF